MTQVRPGLCVLVCAHCFGHERSQRDRDTRQCSPAASAPAQHGLPDAVDRSAAVRYRLRGRLLAYPLLILALTHSVVLAGVVGTAREITLLSLRLPAGALSDRLDRRLTMIICDAVRAVLLALLGILIVLHLGRHRGPDLRCQPGRPGARRAPVRAGPGRPVPGRRRLLRGLLRHGKPNPRAVPPGERSRAQGAMARGGRWPAVRLAGADPARGSAHGPSGELRLQRGALHHHPRAAPARHLRRGDRPGAGGHHGRWPARCHAGAPAARARAPEHPGHRDRPGRGPAVRRRALLIPSPLVAAPVALALLLAPAANAALFAVMLRSAPEEMRGRVSNTLLMVAMSLAPLIAGLLVQHVSGAWATGARRPGKREILQVANYLNPHGTDLFSIILARHAMNDTAKWICREQWVQHNKLIIGLDDDDVRQMLATKMADGCPPLRRRRREGSPVRAGAAARPTALTIVPPRRDRQQGSYVLAPLRALHPCK
jgi:hypothetical protein